MEYPVYSALIHPCIGVVRCLTVEQLVHQLRYRYDRELDRCQRPALRKITEGDDTAAKTLILCIAEINTVSGMIEEKPRRRL